MEDDTDTIKTKLIKEFSETFQKFLKTTSLHGASQLAIDDADDSVRIKDTISRRKNTFLCNIKQIIWLFILGSCLIFCVFLISTILINYESDETRIVIGSTNFPIDSVDFPAVTICNNNKVYVPRIAKVHQELQDANISLTQLEQYFHWITQLSHIERASCPNELKNIESLLTRRNYSVDRLLREIMQPCSELILNCFWLTEPIDCKEMFQTSLTSEGYCCSFNYFVSSEGSSANNLHANIDKAKHVHGAGKYGGLSVVINVSSNTYVNPFRPFYAALVLIHEPYDFPEFSTTLNIVNPGEEASITVDLSIIDSDPAIQQLDISNRRCLLENEKQLNIVNHYSFANCVSECKALYIVKICGCWSYTYPRFLQNYSNTPTCGLEHLECLFKNRILFQTLDFESDENLHQHSMSNPWMRCNCQTPCNSLRYVVKMQTVDATDYIPNSETAIVNVHFEKLTCLRYRREVYLTWDGILSAIGGGFSLCLGGSLITIVEFIYFCIVDFLLRSFRIFKDKVNPVYPYLP